MSNLTPQPPNYQPGPPNGFYQPQAVVPVRNGAATSALVLGIIGFVLTPVPVFIGLVIGGIPDILAIILAIVALSRTARLQGVGKTAAIWGLILGGLGFLSMFIGAGTIW